MSRGARAGQTCVPATEVNDDRERNALLTALGDQRAHVLAALDGLSDTDLRRTVLPSGWTPLGLLRHLTFDVERFWFRVVFGGEHLHLPTDDNVWGVPADLAAHDIIQAYQQEASLADAVIVSGDLGARGARWPLASYAGTPDRDLRATVLHVIAETAGHAGHLDVVRELLDGHQHLVLTQFTDPETRTTP